LCVVLLARVFYLLITLSIVEFHIFKHPLNKPQ